MAHLMLGVLGSLQITRHDSSTVKLEWDRARALLAYLAVEADRPHRREALVGVFWPDYPESTARHNLRQALFNLRTAIGDASAHPPYLLITREELQFNRASSYSLDLAEFEGYLALCDSHRHARLEECAVCAPRLQQALDLYRGRFLQEFFLEDSAEFEEWAVARREAIHQRALTALTALGNYYEGHGDLAAARRSALRQLELDPWREQAHRQIMRVFALEGQRDAAFAQYEVCRRVLAEALGVEPSPETLALYSQIKQGDYDPDRGSRKSIPPEALGVQSLKTSLPTPPTPFLGRERELADLGPLFADPACRWITLVGPGGIGKTRLAIQTASMHRGEFLQGATFVPLVALDSIQAVVPAIADALGFSFYGPTPPRLQLLNYLRDKQMLLVLDNVEQLLGPDPNRGNIVEFIAELLQSAPDVKLLLTSREPLNGQEEWVFDVEGLSLPEGEQIEASSAADLFLQRARRTRAGFALNDQDRVVLARLCHLVEGMPLALELAATWVKTLGLPEIVTEIERNQDFLSAPLRDLPERHKSIRAVMEHSWQRLSKEEQQLLARLSVCPGAFRREAAEQIAGASLSLLSVLVIKSLVRRTSTGRYDLHPLVRQYALDRLRENPMEESATRDRHSHYYLSLLSQREMDLCGPRQADAVAELSPEMDNLRAGWQWAAVQHHIDLMAQAARALYWYYDLRNLAHEGAAVLEQAVAHGRGWRVDHPAKEIAIGHWLAFQAMLVYRQNQLPAAKQLLEQSLVLLEPHADRSEWIDALWITGQVTWARGEFGESSGYLHRALEVSNTARTLWQQAACLILLGIVEYELGRYEDSYRVLMDGLSVARAQGDPTLTSYAISSISRSAHRPGRLVEIESLLREGCQLAKASGNRFAVILSLAQLADVVSAQGDTVQAKRLCRESIALCREQGDDWGLCSTLNQLGNFELNEGDMNAASHSLVEALRVAQRGGFHANVLDVLVSIATTRVRAGDAGGAAEIVAPVLGDPAAKYETRSRAERLHAELELRWVPEQRQAVPAQLKKQGVEQVVEQILGKGPQPPSSIASEDSDDTSSGR